MQADKQAAPVPVSQGRRRVRVRCQAQSVNGRTFFTFPPSPSQVPDAIPSELIATGGQGYRRGAGRFVCQGAEGRCSDFCGRGLTPSNTRGDLCSSCPGKMCARVLRAAAVPWLPMSAGMSQTGAVRGGGTEFAIMTRSCLGPSCTWIIARASTEEVVGPVMERSDRTKVMARLEMDRE